MAEKRLVGYGAVCLSALMYGLGGTVLKTLTNSGVPPLFLIKLRLLGTVMVLLVVLWWWRPGWLGIHRRDFWRFIRLGVFGFAAFMASAMTAVSLAGVGMAVFLQFLAPAMVAVYQRFFCRQPLPGAVTLAILLSMAGGFLMVAGQHRLSDNLAGVGLALLSALCYAYNTVQAKRLSAVYSPVTVLFYGMLVAMVIWLAVPVDFSWQVVARLPVWMYAYMIVCYTLLPYALFYVGIRHLPPVNAGITAASEPVIAAVVAFFALGEQMGGWQMLGGSLVLAAVVVLQLQPAEPGPGPVAAVAGNRAGTPN
ncbi:MAG: DMT family transporter [Negativicutes bacterium]|nr:DMT family transporter [Negativicutes bacterium]